MMRVETHCTLSPHFTAHTVEVIDTCHPVSLVVHDYLTPLPQPGLLEGRSGPRLPSSALSAVHSVVS